MPILKFYGDRLPIGTVGPRQVVSLPATRTAMPPIELNRWFRNGKSPNAVTVSTMNEAANQAALFRTKCVFQMGSWLGVGETIGSYPGPTGTEPWSDRNRWAFACHTGPMTHSLYVITLQVPDSFAPFYSANAGARLDLRTGVLSSSSVVATRNFHYGAHPKYDTSVSNDDWNDLRQLEGFIAVSPDTDYYGQFVDYDSGRLVAAIVFELPSMTENYNGYLSTNITVQSPILDVYREKVRDLARQLWRRGAAHLLNWTVDGESPTGGSGTTYVTAHTIAVNTATNIFDAVSTTYSSSIPGPTLVMDHKLRRGQSTIPCVFKGYMSSSSTSNGLMHLRDSGGTIIATLTYVDVAGTKKWYSANVNLPASTSKYYITHQTAAGTLSSYAASLYQLET